MRKEIINKDCFIGLPACGYGFETARSCFVACPSGVDLHLEVEIIKNELLARNYDPVVAVDNRNFAKQIFCTKICSKIITSHFCIVLLSETVLSNGTKVLNPNVHYEYGLMTALNKHIIPLVSDQSTLAFNVSALDSLKYNSLTLKGLVSEAIDDAIRAYNEGKITSMSREPDVDILRFMSLNGRVIADIYGDFNKLMYDLGGYLGYFLFVGDTFVFFLNAKDSTEVKIANDVQLLYRNLDAQISRIRRIASSQNLPDSTSNPALIHFVGVEVVVLVSSGTQKGRLQRFIESIEIKFPDFPRTCKFITREEVATANEHALPVLE